MTVRCSDLDRFFDGELSVAQAAVFRDHLATCPTCEAALLGRMQEDALICEERAAWADQAREVRRALRLRRWALPAIAAVAAAAVVALCLRPGEERAAEPLAIKDAVERGGTLKRGVALERSAEPSRLKRGRGLSTGDHWTLSLRGGAYRALYVYLDNVLLAHCPGDPRCRDADGELAIPLELALRGGYIVIGARAASPLPFLPATPDDASAQLLSAGIKYALVFETVD